MFGMPKMPPIVVVYDVDDICWPFSQRVADKLGFDRALMTDFWTEQIPHFSVAEKQAIRREFENPEMFQEMNFYPGLRQLLDPLKLGAEIQFNSNSANQAIVDPKREQLLAALPGLDQSCLQMNVVNLAGTRDKKLPKEVFILADDNPYTIARSHAEIHVLQTKPWNATEKAKTQMADRTVMRFADGDLVGMANFIYQQVAARRERYLKLGYHSR